MQICERVCLNDIHEAVQGGKTFLRCMAPLAGASMLKTSLPINELTFLLGNAIRLVVLCCLSFVCPCSVRACDFIGSNGLCVLSSCAHVRAHALCAI